MNFNKQHDHELLIAFRYMQSTGATSSYTYHCVKQAVRAICGPRGWTWHIYKQGSAEYFVVVFFFWGGGLNLEILYFFWVLVTSAVFFWVVK